MSSSTTATRPYPGAATITHLSGCPVSDQQPDSPMPERIEVYRVGGTSLDDRSSDDRKPAAPATTVSHCKQCGATAYAKEPTR